MSETVSHADRGDVVETAFGTVTGSGVTYFYNKGWFSPGSREDLPLRHVTSVSLEMTRRIGLGCVLVLVALAALAAGDAAILLGILLFVPAALLLWGSPTVIVNTAGGDRRPSKGLPWAKPEAEKFVGALRTQLFKE